MKYTINHNGLFHRNLVVYLSKPLLFTVEKSGHVCMYAPIHTCIHTQVYLCQYAVYSVAFGMSPTKTLSTRHSFNAILAFIIVISDLIGMQGWNQRDAFGRPFPPSLFWVFTCTGIFWQGGGGVRNSLPLPLLAYKSQHATLALPALPLTFFPMKIPVV